ncbi:hypothetical protein [Tepidibacillus marianensis]|uniref:hypothetical protein n=1 Tax=Tepidibacillus marianensis TaxID=3131995 RepID=UPI0030CFDB35
MKIGNQTYSQIVITSTNEPGKLVTADEQKEVIAIISDDDEIIVKNGYEVKMIPASDNAD